MQTPGHAAGMGQERLSGRTAKERKRAKTEDGMVEISYNCAGVIELPDTNEMDSKTA